MPDKILQVNTGLLLGDEPTTYQFGSTSPIKHEVRNSLRDWRGFRSQNEQQNMNPDDRMACVSFSGASIWEQQANWMLFNNLWPADALKFWNDNGFVINGKFEISRRFIAKLSGTTRNGNYFYRVWDSIRKNGIIPDVKYPDDKTLSWDQYYQEVPTDLVALGLQSLKFFSLLYESLSVALPAQMLMALETSPLQFGVTTQCGWNTEVPICGQPANHAVDMDHMELDLSFDIFDSYDPFSKHLQKGYVVPICYRAVLYPIQRNQPIVPPASPVTLPSPYALTQDLRIGDYGNGVVRLKKALNKLGWLNWTYDPGKLDHYDEALAEVVYNYQKANVSRVFWEMIFSLKGKLVGPRTREVINQELKSKP